MRELSKEDLRWVLRRTPVAVLQVLKQWPGTVFAGGGFVRAVVAGEKPSDVDLFAASVAAAREVAVFVQSKVQGARLSETDNAFTVHGGGLPFPVQVIHRWTYESAEQLVASFDFTIAMATFWWRLPSTDGGAVKSEGWNSVCDDRFYEDLAARRLRYTSPRRLEDAGGSLLRVLKFYQRGYRIPLDSLGAVVARLVNGVREYGQSEEDFARVVTGLLREVDPNIDQSHIAHLPASDAPEEDEDATTT